MKQLGVIRRFEKEDWYGYAGAEVFSNNTNPFIYEREMNDGAVGITIIADKNGLEIDVCDTSCASNEVLTWWKDLKLSALQAEGELRHLIKYLDQYTYAPDLTYALDHPDDETVNGFEFMGEF